MLPKYLLDCLIAIYVDSLDRLIVSVDHPEREYRCHPKHYERPAISRQRKTGNRDPYGDAPTFDLKQDAVDSSDTLLYRLHLNLEKLELGFITRHAAIT
jgi:hypothetical protein